MQALAQAIRALKKTPGLSLLVVLILAIGIGANTSVFTLINAALLKPLPYRDAAHLMSVSTIDRSGGTTNGCLSYPHFQLLAGRSRSFSEIAAFTNETFSVSTGAAEPIESQAARVSWNFFAVLGVAPAIGRAFTAEEGNAGAKPVVMISNAFWRQRFHGNPSVIGKLIDLDSKPYTIIGVVPPSFQFGLLGDDINIWTPHIDELNLASTQQIQGGTCYLDSVARLAPGISIEQAQAEMKVLDRVYVRDFAKMGDADPKRPVEVTLLKSKLVGNFRSIFVVLAAAVGLVAFIACANAAGLLLTRVLRRRREVAIRIAMGAARKQLLSQFLTESVTLALLGGIVGVILSLAATRLLVRLAGDTLPRMAELPAGIDLVVLAFAFALSILCGVLCGLAPALQFSAANVSANLREEGRGTAGARSRNFSRNLLVVGQIAITLILLVAAGLLIRSFILLETQAPGFNSRNVLTMSIALPPSKYVKPEQMTGFFDQLVRRVRTLPSVEAAAVSSALPINVARLTPIWVEGQPQQLLPERPIIIVQAYTAGYLRVMQIPLKRGRFFNDFDRRDSLPVT
ncbi:MAG TPA: ABC transporter permease, partial [Bryobacteraceae bacterium]|nr:ABC transporter permease [Bryobacteraceae bacterium]